MNFPIRGSNFLDLSGFFLLQSRMLALMKDVHKYEEHLKGLVSQRA